MRVNLERQVCQEREEHQETPEGKGTSDLSDTKDQRVTEVGVVIREDEDPRDQRERRVDGALTALMD